MENNYRLYHMVNCRRRQFAGANLKVASGEWRELRVEAVGNRITCYYTAPWTRPSVTSFDDLKVVAR